MPALRGGIFPEIPQPRSLQVLDVRPYGWHESFMLTSLQGLVNRAEPRIYLVFDDFVDRMWLGIYRERYGIPYAESDRLEDLVGRFSAEAAGYVVYDDSMLHSANVAMSWGGVHDALAVSPSLVPLLERAGLRKLEDFRGRWRDRLEAYEWALDNLLPRCRRS